MEQGWCSGLGLIPAQCHKEVVFVISCHLALRVFLASGFFGFSPPQKPTSAKSNSARIENLHENPAKTDVASSLIIIINLLSVFHVFLQEVGLYFVCVHV